MEVEGEKIRILLIEDNPGDARLIRELLAEGGGASFDLEHVDCLSKGLTRLAQGGVGIVLLDLTLPDSHDLDGLGKILAQTLEVPIVVLSGVSDERVTIKAVRGGAQDYLVKGKIDSNLLVRSLRYAIERQRLRVALHESEALYRLLANNIADVIWTADAEARITYVSPSIKRVLGYTVEETLKLKISDILTPDSTEQARRLVKWQMKTFARGVQYPPASMTLEHVRKDGSTVWAEVMLSFMQDKNGNVTGIMGATRDITERRKAEEALQKSEARYRLLADNAVDLIWTMDIKGRITYASPSAERLFGYSVDELMALKIRELLTPASAETVRKAMNEEMATKATGLQDPHRSLLLEHVRKDGSTVWTEVMISFLRDEQGRLIGVQGVTRDITKRRKAEEALRESEQRYRLLAENVNDIIWTRDMNLRTTYVSPSVTQMSGYSVEEVMSISLEESITPASLEVVKNAFSKVIAAEEGQRDLSAVTVLEVELIHKNGSIVPVEMKVNLLRDSDGRLIGFLGVTRDITERKKTEEALRKSERRYRLLAENVKDVIWTVDMNLRLTYTSPSITQLTGYRHEEYITKTLEEILTPASVEFVTNLFAEELALEDSGHSDLFRARTFEAELICKDGSTVPVEMKATGLRDADGRPIGLLGVSRDITERKQAENSLRESEARFRTIFEGTGLSIALVDFNGKTLSINPAFEHMLGYNLKEFKEIEGSLKYQHPDDATTDAKFYIEMLKGKREHYTVDKRYIRKDGALIWGRQNLSVIRDASGKPEYFIAMIEDITERKHMEESLHQSEERYRELFENANDIIYIHDLTGNFISINKAAELVTGYTRDEVIGMNIAHLLTPESMERARQMIARKVSDGGQTRYELEIVTKDGHKVLLEVNTRLIYEGGKPVGTQGIARDITERKKMEEELRRLSDAVRMSTDSITIADLQGNIVDVNEATVKIQLANSKSDLIGLKFSDFIAPEEQEKALEDLGQVIEKGYITGVEYHILTRDGRKILVETNASIMKGKGGEPTGLVAVTRDITERKRAEEELRLLSDAVKMSKDSIVITDLEGRIIEANDATLEMHRVDNREDLIGRLALELIAPEDHEMLTEKIAKGMAEGGPIYVEYHCVTKDGRKLLVDTNVSAMKHRNGEPIGYMAVVRDITERKRIEEALRQSEQSYRVLLESTHDSIIVVDAETFKITFGNRRASMMFGFDPVLQDAVGMNLLDFVHPEDREIAIKGFMEDLYQAERRRRYDVRAKTQDGRELWISALGTRIEFQGRIAVLLSLRDVTKDKQMEEEKRKLENQIQLAGRLAAVGELAAGVAHELNNPITAIKGYAQLLTKKKELDEPLRKDLETIYRESQRAARITQNLLSFARKHEPEKHLISLNEVIEKTLELRAHPMKVNNIELVVELTPDLPKTSADFHQMQQVFVNIINNAEQAMIEAHGKGRLVVKTKKMRDMIQISFADDGPGIPEDNIKRIFDPFFTTKEVGKGTGLGLSICYGLVEAHGGRIYARSKLGQGANFVVEIPIVSEDRLVAEAALLNPGSRGVTWKKPREQY